MFLKIVYLGFSRRCELQCTLFLFLFIDGCYKARLLDKLILGIAIGLCCKQNDLRSRLDLKQYRFTPYPFHKKSHNHRSFDNVVAEYSSIRTWYLLINLKRKKERSRNSKCVIFQFCVQHWQVEMNSQGGLGIRVNKNSVGILPTDSAGCIKTRPFQFRMRT